jgi:hypothetical protein
MFDINVSDIVLFVMIGLYIWRQIHFDRTSQNRREAFDKREQDLITRLMSRDAIEYANVKRLTRHASPVTVADAIDKLQAEGIDAEEFIASGDESIDRVRVA